MSDSLRLAEFIAGCPRLAVITGAGCSTDSGIGDYRDSAGRWKHSQPIQYADFMAAESVRRRYWARSMLGWPQFAQATANPAHHALVKLEAAGHVTGLITQNVDGLHQLAGHKNVLDLHGRLDRVSCQSCGDTRSRSALQESLLVQNAALLPQLREQRRAQDRQIAASREKKIEPAPDGDARLSVISAEFAVPACLSCGGILKPDVVFYGQSVPKAWVEQAYNWVSEADGLLVVGSSLMVFSSFRFCRAAAAADKPIAILNRGVTRADELAALKLDAACASTLVGLTDLLAPIE